jgi:hypothetical protein
MDVPLSSGLASTPGILTSWEPAGVKPRLPLPQISAKRRDEVRSRELLEGAAARDERPPIACAVPIPAPESTCRTVSCGRRFNEDCAEAANHFMSASTDAGTRRWDRFWWKESGRL